MRYWLGFHLSWLYYLNAKSPPLLWCHSNYDPFKRIRCLPYRCYCVCYGRIPETFHSGLKIMSIVESKLILLPWNKNDVMSLLNFSVAHIQSSHSSPYCFHSTVEDKMWLSVNIPLAPSIKLSNQWPHICKRKQLSKYESPFFQILF